MIRRDDGVLALRLPPAEARARIQRAFDCAIVDRSFALRVRAPRSPVQYVLHGRIEDDRHGARIALERRLRGGEIGAAIVVSLAVAISIALFVFMALSGQAGLIEWMGLLFVPWVLLVLGHGAYARLALASTEIDAVKERLEDLFDDVIVARDTGPYR